MYYGKCILVIHVNIFQIHQYSSHIKQIYEMNIMQITPIRLIKRDAAKLLGLSVDGLNKLAAKDPLFSKPYKTSDARQAHVYFDYADLLAWHNTQKANAVMEV